MITSRHHSFARLLFAPYLRYLFRKYFHRLNIPASVEGLEQGKSILLIANHFSWWDGFFWYQVNKLVFRKNFHIMMLEEQLERFWFFKYLGAFSVKKNSRSVLKSLEYAANLLEDPDNMVVIFPQGEIEVPWIHQMNMGKGAAHIWKKAQVKAQLVYGVVLTHYGSQPKPTATFYMQPAQSTTAFAHYYHKVMQQAATDLREE